MKRPYALLLLLTSCFLVGCPTHPRPLAQPQPLFVQGAYTHALSGMIFPLSIGEFRRSAVLRYDEDGQDVSAGYDLYDSQLKMIATVYVYPAPPIISIGSPPGVVATARAISAKNHYEANKRSILSSYAGARLIEDTEISLPIGKHLRVGRMATFEFEQPFNGLPQQVRSHLCLFDHIGGRWMLKYRLTYPKSLELTKEIDTILLGLPWNVPAEQE